MLGRAIGNLIDNACKHAPAPGEVHIAVGPAGDEGGTSARVTVTDAGPGIPAELQARIFEPFFRGGEARATTEGVGLGLPFAHSVALAHGGALVLIPVARGACFALTVPAFASPGAD